MVAFDKVPRDINSVLAFKNTKIIESELNQFVIIIKFRYHLELQIQKELLGKEDVEKLFVLDT